MSTHTEELPIYVIHGANWQVEVPIDEFNSQFEPEVQAMEAATQAIEAFKGINENIFLKLDEGEEKPFIGPTLLAYLKGENATKGMIVFTHVILGNAGFYGDSVEMAGVLKIEWKAIEEELARERKKIITPLDEPKVKKPTKATKKRKKKE